MNCDRIKSLLPAYCDNEVNEEDKRLITQHLESCHECQKEKDLLTALSSHVTQAFKTATAQAEPSPRAWSHIRQQLKFGTSDKATTTLTRLSGLLPRQSRWRVALASIFLVFLVLAVSLITPSSSKHTRHGDVAYFNTPAQGAYFNPVNEIASASFASIDDYTDFLKQYQSSIRHSSAADYYDYRSPGITLTISPAETSDESVTITGYGFTTRDSYGSFANSRFTVNGNTDYSKTNVQVAGVDEADILKTDGNYIYTVTENTLFIIKAYPGEEAEVVSTIDFDSNYPSGLFINGDNLAIFGNDDNSDLLDEMSFQPSDGITFFDIYDISDRSNPVLTKEYKIEGYYNNARMIDNWVYFVAINQPSIRPDYPTPVILEGSTIRSIPVNDIYYFNIPYNYPQLVTVHSINIANVSEDMLSKSITVESGLNLYMSQQNMFITYTEYVDENEIRNEIIKDVLANKITEADQQLIDKIQATDDDVLSEYEKESKIMQVYYSYLDYLPQDDRDLLWDEIEDQLAVKLEEFEFYEYTVINKIGVNNGQINVVGNGKVPGHIMNQFSLDEDTNSSVLRIATTVNSRRSNSGSFLTDQTNNIYTLDSSLNIICELEGLAESEQIYSTRFIGDKLYMVTFRQTDPFFVIDLSDPQNIRELGELKIPGFSRYLHPYDENTIIGLGEDATESGRTKGLKISLFDISDFSNPKEIAKWVSDERYVDSTALYEHKAFLFSKEKELLVIPASGQVWEGRHSDNYSGAMVFGITKDDIHLRDLIDHGEWQSVERSLYIDNLLYTKSPNLLKINKLADLSLVKDIKLEVK